MKNFYYFCTKILFYSLLIVQLSQSLTTFECDKRKDPGISLPPLPNAYTSRAKLNFESHQYSVEMREVSNIKDKKSSFDVWSAKGYTKYIVRGDQDALLVIRYKEDEHPSCVKKPLSKDNIFEDDDAGPKEILYKIHEVSQKPSNFYNIGPTVDDGITVQQWEGCFDDPKINVKLSFAVPSWKRSRRGSSLVKEDVWELTKVEAVIGDEVALTADIFSFDTRLPADEEFQPPEDSYCEGFRTDRKPPSLPSYFSYQSEIVVYESSEGIAPIVSHRTVYYDYASSICRIDFQDALADNKDMFSPVSARVKSVIHDFNTGVQYTINPVDGQCKVDTFKATFGVLSAKETVDNAMLNSKQFFSLDGDKISYNGQYRTRGLDADVYSSTVKDDKDTRIVHWYFSTGRTQLVENEHVERNVLLRMLSRPQSADGTSGQVEINFYNFVQEEPTAFVYDLTNCYNETHSKKWIITFPGSDRLTGMKMLLRGNLHQSIQNAAGVSKQRVFIKEVIVRKSYIFAEFWLLGSPPVDGKTSKEFTLEESASKLRNAVASGAFNVTIKTKDYEIILHPEPNGLNEFAGDRITNPPVIGYKEGSVIGLTIGMLFLGTLLGAITVNLIISKKFGVSLFQKSGYGNKPFENPLNESSM